MDKQTYYEKNKERILASRKEKRSANLEQEREKEKIRRSKKHSDPETHAAYKEYLRTYHKKNKDRLSKQKKEYLSKKKLENPEFAEKERIRSLIHYHDQRREVFNAYGGMKCACCGETTEMFLTIDHINNDGASHRRAISNSPDNGKGANIYGWLKKNNYPPGFQVLCMNCNHGKARNGGICPHISTVKEQ